MGTKMDSNANLNEIEEVNRLFALVLPPASRRYLPKATSLPFGQK